MAQSQLPARKQLRVTLGSYAESERICSITIAVRNRQRAFTDLELAQQAESILIDNARNTGVRVYAWCFMPDHVHFIVSPSASCDLITFVGSFKNLVQRAGWRLGLAGLLWQPRFWDHFLRSDEAIRSAITYVLDNPVRSGLTLTRSDYLYSGSLEMPWLKEERSEGTN